MSSFDAILFGLLAVLPWGLADFSAARGSKKVGPLEMLFVTQVAGLVLIGVIFFAVEPVWISFFALSKYFFCFSLLACGFVCFYRGLAYGPVGIVCAIAAAYALVTALLMAALREEVLTSLQWVGVVSIFVGTALASYDRTSLRIGPGVVYALGAALSWGVYYVFLTPVVDTIGWLPTIFYRYLCTVVWLFIVLLLLRKNIPKAFRSVGFSVDSVVIVVGELIGQFALHFGMTRALTSIIVPVSSLSPMVTVVMAWVFLKEHLRLQKVLGIIFIVGGLVLLK